MKKIAKAIVALGAGLGALSFVNREIFRKAQKAHFEPPFGNYRSKYGNISYNRVGSGKEILLLIHGIGAGASQLQWARNIEALSEGYTVYTLDLLGYGFSDKPDMEYSAYFYQGLINSFIEDVIGESVNAVASANSAEFLMHAQCFKPDNFKKLVLVSPMGLDFDEESRKKALKELMSLGIVGTSISNAISSKKAIKKFLQDKTFYNKALATDKLVEEYYYFSHSGKNPAGNKYPLAAFLSNYLESDIKRLLQSTQKDIMVIWGENNELNSVNNIRTCLDLNENIKAVIFKKTGLMPYYENPKAFEKHIREFI